MRTGSSEPAATSRCIDCFETPRSAALCVWLRSAGFSSLMAVMPVWFGYASAQKGAKRKLRSFLRAMPTVGARVEHELAQAVAALAAAGDRTISRQIRRALVEHVDRQSLSAVGTSSRQTPAGHHAGRGSALGDAA